MTCSIIQFLQRRSFVLPLVVCPIAGAALIPINGIEGFQEGDSAPGGDGSITRAIDGSGMTMTDPADPATWTASSIWQDDWQGGNANFSDSNLNWIVIDLGSPQAVLETMYLWNVNEVGHTARGVMNFEVFAATAPTVTPPPTGANQSYDFRSGGWTDLGSGVLDQGTGVDGLTPGIFDISAAAGARYIGIRPDSFHANDVSRVGLAEIAFTDTADANAIVFGPSVPPVDPPEQPEPSEGEIVPITGVFGFHQGDSFDGDGSILRVTDASIDSSLDPEDPTTWTHSNAWQDDWQGFEAPGVTPNGTWIVLDLGETISNLGTLLLWNVNEGSWSSRGTNEFRLHSATTPAVAPPEAGGTPMAYDFTSGGWTAFGDTRVLPRATETTDQAVNGIVDLTGMPPARYLGIEILSNHGATGRVGLSHAAILNSLNARPEFQIISIDTSEKALDRVSITWNAVAGVGYNVETSPDLESWTEVADDVRAEDGSDTATYTYSHPDISETDRLFFRVTPQL